MAGVGEPQSRLWVDVWAEVEKNERDEPVWEGGKVRGWGRQAGMPKSEQVNPALRLRLFVIGGGTMNPKSPLGSHLSTATRHSVRGTHT